MTAPSAAPGGGSAEDESELIAARRREVDGVSHQGAGPGYRILRRVGWPEEEGQASGTNNGARELGSVLGVTVLAAARPREGRR